MVKTNNVTVFDIKTLKHIIDLPAGENPDALLYDAFSNSVFIFNNDSKNITVIDAKTDTVVTTFEVGGNPEADVTDKKGLISVNLEDLNEIVVFDSKTLTIKKRFKLALGEEPNGLAFDKNTHRLFSTCRKNQMMMVLNADNGQVGTQLPIGKGVDGIVFNRESNLLFSSNGEDTITVIKELLADKFAVIDTIKTQIGARTMAIDSKAKHLFTVSAQYGERPAPTPENPRPRPKIVPNTFTIYEFSY